MKDRNNHEHSEENGRFVRVSDASGVSDISDIPPMARQPDDLGGVRKVAAQSGKNDLTQPVRRAKVNLPRQEYAELCSAIRTRYGDKIPRSSTMYYGDNYYAFGYSKSAERIVCVEKTPINSFDKLDVMKDYKENKLK